MNLRKPLIILVLAVATSLAIALLSKSEPYHERLIRIQAEQELARIDTRILSEPLDIQAMLLDYSKDRVLLLKAWVALTRYPDQSREVMRLYGDEPAFKDILRGYGEVVIPLVKYFLDHDVLTIKVMVAVKTGVQVVTDAFNDAWNWMSGNTPTPQTPVAVVQPGGFGTVERGWQAISFVQEERYKFIQQFDIDATGKAEWNQTSRVVTGVSSFFSSGIENLERKYVLHDDIKINDVFFATIDLVPFVASLKLLKAGKVATASGKELSIVSRTRIFAPKLIPKGEFFLQLGKWGAVAATAYIVVAHPSLLNSLFAEAAKLMGLNPLIVQIVGWTLLVAIALYPFSWLLIGLARGMIFTASLLGKAARKTSPTPS